VIFGLDFPPISHTVEWPTIFLDGAFAVNKVVLLMWLSVVLVLGFFLIAGRKRDLVPTGVQNVGEATVDFIQDGIILQTLGEDNLHWTPFLMTMFSFVFVCNIWEIIPFVQMPVNARIALPAFLAIMVWCIYHFLGMKHQGFFTYWKNIMVVPGAPAVMHILLTPIELVTKLITQPLSMAVRLFANMLAGHLLLISFIVLSGALFDATKVGAVLPFALLVALTGFEVLVAFLQAYIITILTGVYISQATHPAH
jgi:F-type H+-transporting ATPase subunit a